MEIPYSRLTMLFKNYYSGLATEAEIDELMLLIKESKDDKQLAELIKNVWENQYPDEKQFSKQESEKMLHSILYMSVHKHDDDYLENKIRTLGWVRYAAASIIFIAGITMYWLGNRPTENLKVMNPKEQFADILPGGNKAVLTLSDGQQLNIDNTVVGYFGKNGTAEFTQTGAGKLNAVVFESAKASDLQFNKLSTPKGGQYQITLQDGSNVWLNASSSIRFPTVFSEVDRVVEIYGEAYFDIIQDINRPFIVKFGTSEVEVLGTSFNIMAYEEENMAKTTLVEGSVKLRNGSKSQTLKPGEQGVVQDRGEIQKTLVDIEQQIAWKNGLFYFKDSSIEEVMRQTARWYNIEVKYKGKMNVRQFTGKVPRNVNISELLNMLRYAGVNFEITGKEITIHM